ncbi:MAG: hypothetical protein U0269_05430 [Polyangiales bacterium]
MGSVTLDALAAGLRRRGTPLASESALFLALECAEAIVAAPRSLDVSKITIDPEGRVDASVCADSSETQAIRSIGACVRALCEPLPSTVREFVRRTDDGSILTVSGATSELEALLVPLNRAAARRVVARLVREVAKEPSSDRVSAPAPVAAPEAAPVSTALASSVDTEPDGAPIGATSSAGAATATVADMTPLPSKLPPPPRLGSLVTLPIGPSHGDDLEPHVGAAEASASPAADRTVIDEPASDRPRSDAEESLDEPKRAPSVEGRRPLVFVAVFFLVALVFFVWRLSHR